MNFLLHFPFTRRNGVGRKTWDWNFKCGALHLKASVFLLLLCLHAQECCFSIALHNFCCHDLSTWWMEKKKTLQSQCYIQSILSLLLLACLCITMALHLLVFLLLTTVFSLLTQAMVETVNNLLQPRAQVAWRELPTSEQQLSATLLLDTVETGAFMLADNLLKTDTIQEVTDNIRKNFFFLSSSFEFPVGPGNCWDAHWDAFKKGTWLYLIFWSFVVAGCCRLPLQWLSEVMDHWRFRFFISRSERKVGFAFIYGSRDIDLLEQAYFTSPTAT